MKPIFLLFAGCLFQFTLFAQELPNDRNFTAIRNGEVVSFKAQDVITDPPNLSPRTMAEWEELSAIAVCWDLNWDDSKKKLIAAIIRNILDEVQVVVFCSGGITFNLLERVAYELESGGIDVSQNLVLVEQNFDTRIWIRDFGAQTIYLNDVDSLVMIDWLYEPQFSRADRDLPLTMAAVAGVPLFGTYRVPYSLKLDGGNFMSDGRGLAISSSHIFDDNQNYAPETVDYIVDKFMGIDRFAIMEKLDHDAIHHVDMHLKLLDEETILVGQYPPGVADYEKIENNISNFLSNFKTTFGADFQVIRIPMPRDENGSYPDVFSGCSELGTGCYYTYTNALFVNKTILVPTFFNGENTDKEALEIWRAAKPGYKIVGIDCRDIIKEYGAIHCVTKEIGSRQPVLITHQKIANPCEDELNFEVQAVIKGKAGIQAARVFYSDSPQNGFDNEPLYPVGKNNWVGSIPAYPEGTKVYYYIEVLDKKGKIMRKPMPGADGPWTFTVGCQTTASDEPEPLKEFKIFPNPVREMLFIEGLADETDTYRISIRNLLGEIVLAASENLRQVSVAHFPKGLYYLIVENQGFTNLGKFLKN